MGPCDQNQNLPSWESKTSWLHPNNPATKTRICPTGKARPAGCTLTTCDQNQNLPSWEHKTSWLNPASKDQKLASTKNKSIASHDANGPDGWLSIDLFIKRIQQR